jgi:hypothetical protein
MPHQTKTPVESVKYGIATTHRSKLHHHNPEANTADKATNHT